MHQNNDIYCYLNNEIATRQQVCESFCTNETIIFNIFFPFGFIIIISILSTIILYKIKRQPSENKKEIGSQCDFSTVHHIVLEPDNSLSIVCDNT